MTKNNTFNLTLLETAINKLSLREKILLLITSLTLIFFSWRTFLLNEVLHSKQTVSKKMSNIKSQVDLLKKQAVDLSNYIIQDPTIALLKQKEELTKTNDTLLEKIKALTNKFISPQNMTFAIQDLLKQAEQLSISNIQNIKAIPMTDNTKTSDNIPPIFMHGLSITFNGQFHDTLAFLMKIEQLNWNFIWTTLEYTVKEHPNAKINLILHTFSNDKTWIGT